MVRSSELSISVHRVTQLDEHALAVFFRKAVAK
jgi:hypothetical protein